MSKPTKAILQTSFAITAAFLCSMSLASAAETAESATTTAMLVAPAASGQSGSAAIEPGTYDAAVPTVRQIETDAISGGDADPEIFDRQGFESWWRHYEPSLAGVN